MFGNGRDDDDIVRAGFARVVNADRNVCFASRRGAAGGAMTRFDRDVGQRIFQCRPAVSDQAHDVRSHRSELERGDRGLQLDGGTIFDRTRDAVRNVDATLFGGRDIADLRPGTREQR